jgi:dTDP-4-amino-4,6-dideoxygalactose transaminase
LRANKLIRCLIPDLPTANDLIPWLARIDESHRYSNFGPLCGELENGLIGILSQPAAHCATLASGTAALELGLKALGIGTGSRVLLPALTFPATALAVMRCGAVPVLSDVCPDGWMLTPEIVRRCIERERFDLIMPVAAFGMPLPGEAWDEFTAETRVPVFADAAAALGVQHASSRLHWGFSLHATKPLGVGEGGLFVSCDEELVQRVRRMSNYGFETGIVHHPGGTNAKLSEYAAAIGLAQLQRWPDLLVRRKAVLDAYRERLNQVPGVRLQPDSAGVPATLCVRVPADAAKLLNFMQQNEIECRRWYLPPLHEHPAFADLPRMGVDGSARFPATEELARSLIGLPFHTSLSADQIARIVTVLADGVSQHR